MYKIIDISKIKDTIFLGFDSVDNKSNQECKVLYKDDFDKKIVFLFKPDIVTNKVFIYEKGILRDEFGKSINAKLYLSEKEYKDIKEVEKLKSKIFKRINHLDVLVKLNKILEILDN